MKHLGMILFTFVILGYGVFFIEESEAAEETENIEIRTIPVDVSKKSENADWTLQYKIRDSDLFVECIVSDLSLSSEEKQDHGYLLVKMNGQKAAEMGQAAFMMENLPPGTHKMEITPKSYDGKTEKEPIVFEVEVPSS